MNPTILLLADTDNSQINSTLISFESGPPPFLMSSSFDKVLSIVSSKYEQSAKKRRIYTLNFFMSVKIPSFSLEDFRLHFRLQKSTYEILYNALAPNLSKSDNGKPKVKSDKQILLSLWTLVNQESFREVSDRFDIDRGLCYRVFTRFVLALFDLRNEYIKFPVGEDLKVVERGFQQLRVKPFPGAVGAIDGSHIPVPSPREDKQSFYNRNKYYSVILQGICDHQMIFMNVFAGWPGASHDANVYKHSRIFDELRAGNLLEPDQHLLGDSAYPLSTFLLVPFRNDGTLQHIHKRFNKRLSSSRVVIEQAFGLLKTRFRRLKKLDMHNLELLPKVIVVSCILHNLCIKNNDFIENEEDLPEETELYNGNEDDLMANGNNKRMRMAEYFMQNN